MSTLGDVHVGDVGTKYLAKVQDNGVPFDFSAAITKKLVFQLPDGTIKSFDATVVHPDSDWYLQYIITAADVVAGMHGQAGSYIIQGYIVIDSGHVWYTTVESYIVARNVKTF